MPCVHVHRRRRLERYRRSRGAHRGERQHSDVSIPRLYAARAQTLAVRVNAGWIHRPVFEICVADFVSVNCLREVVASIDQGKPRIIVHEADPEKGGGRLDELCNELDDTDHRDAIFSDDPLVITWYRLSEFQFQSHAAGTRTAAVGVTHLESDDRCSDPCATVW